MSEQDKVRVRASDAEREQVAAALRDAMGEGRLDLAEGEERLARAYAATYRDQLPELTSDLPPYQPAGEPGGSEPGGPGPGAFRRGDRPAGSAGHPGGPGQRRPRPAAGFAAVLAVATGVWALAAGGPLWPAILFGVLALVIAKHSGPGCGRGPDRASRRAWEHRHHRHHRPAASGVGNWSDDRR